MTPQAFCYFLQGFFELSEGSSLSVTQVGIIRKKLSSVFQHVIDPSFPEEIQQPLTDAHNSGNDAIWIIDYEEGEKC